MARDTQSTISLIEEATHLLRRAPASSWLCYYLGSLPFVAYLFYFWSDMSRSAVARSHVVESSLVLALLYWWMKVWQALHAGLLLSIVEGKTESAPTKKRAWLRLITSQAWIHATMPWVLSFSLVAMLPFGWAYAFYHNVTVLAAEHYREGGRTKQLWSRALAQSHYQPMQNHRMLLMLFVTAVFVYFNFGIGFYTVAMLAKSFTGFENDFTRQPMLMMSSPVQMLIISGSYLVMGPLLKALYVLRCFYGQARRSGADIEVQLRQLRASSGSALAALLVFGLLAVPGVSSAESKPPPDAKRSVELKRSINEVLTGSEYQWRAPREDGTQPEDKSWLGQRMAEFKQWIDDRMDAFARAWRRFLRSIFGDREYEDPDAAHGTRDSAFVRMLPTILYSLIALLVILLGVMVWRNWMRWKKDEPEEVAAEGAAEINLESEHVVATQLPENEWLRLAREKIESGELRLALRALFLATLAHLGEKNLIAVTRSKSNGDYRRELGWRARGREDITGGFTEQVRSFDRAWYGWHDVSTEDLARFQEQHERITAHAT